MTLYTAIDALATTNPRRLASLLHTLMLHNPEARRYLETTLAPITPEGIESDDTLTDAEKAQCYDALFEDGGEEDDE